MRKDVGRNIEREREIRKRKKRNERERKERERKERERKERVMLLFLIIFICMCWKPLYKILKKGLRQSGTLMNSKTLNIKSLTTVSDGNNSFNNISLKVQITQRK